MKKNGFFLEKRLKTGIVSKNNIILQKNTCGKDASMKISYIPSGVCSRKIEFELSDDHIVSGVKFTGGCPGNAIGISRLAEGRKAEELISLLSGVRCGMKPTSCPDQFAKALKEQLGL